MVAILRLKASKLIVYFVSFTVVIFTILRNNINSVYTIVRYTQEVRDKEERKKITTTKNTQNNIKSKKLITIY